MTELRRTRNTAASPRAAKPAARRGTAARTGLAALALGLAAQAALMVYLDRYGQRDRVRGAGAADAIIILGASVRPGGEIGPSLRARSRRALELYRAGAASKLIPTGGLGLWPPEEAVATAAWLQRQGVPASAIVPEKTSTSTRENLHNAAAICRARGWRRVIIVSDPYHLWRAERVARAAGLEPIISPSPSQAASVRLYMTWRESFAALRELLSSERPR